MAVSATMIFFSALLTYVALSSAMPNLQGPKTGVVETLQSRAGDAFRQAVRTAVLGSAICDPPCASNECCLLKPGATKTVCEPIPLSGRHCGWYHCSDSNNKPDRVVPTSNTMCPCHNGGCCFGSVRNGAFDGSCTFLK